MSLAIKYENTDDARMRLRGTVVLYKGEPVQITEVQRGDEGEGPLRVMMRELPVEALGGMEARIRQQPDEPKRKYISSKHFDIAPFKMGYVNSKAGAFYCSRLPNRVQKQGLCAENFKSNDNYGKQIGFPTFLGAKGVPDMIKGTYPSFDEAMKLLGKIPAVAFSREFCLTKDEVIPDIVYLYHKGAKVGMYSRDGLGLGKKFMCLKESIQEMGIKVGVL